MLFGKYPTSVLRNEEVLGILQCVVPLDMDVGEFGYGLEPWPRRIVVNDPGDYERVLFGNAHLVDAPPGIVLDDVPLDLIHL